LQRVHSITKRGNKVPKPNLHTPNDKQTSLRDSEKFVQLSVLVGKAAFVNALVKFLVICQIALSLATNAVFLEFLRLLFPAIDKLMPKSSNTIRGWIMEAYNSRKLELKESLRRSKSRVHFSFDLWSSPNHLALLGIIAHYIDELGQNQSVSYARLLLLSRSIQHFISIPQRNIRS
jgi:hypothetical protein